jgi:hypothetical protein
MLKSMLAICTLAAFIGCGPAALPELRADHPASPAAAEGIVLWHPDDLSSATAGNLAVDNEAPSHRGGAPPEARHVHGDHGQRSERR